MVLLTHWNLRDEIKSNYAPIPNAHEKQEMVYRVMQHIVEGTIPQDVINNASYDWAPYSNRTWKDGKEVTLSAEENRRYERILAHFQAMKKIDQYEPQQPTGIIRNFEGSTEILPSEIEELFSSPDFFEKYGKDSPKLQAELEDLKNKQSALYERWEFLEQKKERCKK